MKQRIQEAAMPLRFRRTFTNFTPDRVALQTRAEIPGAESILSGSCAGFSARSPAPRGFADAVVDRGAALEPIAATAVEIPGAESTISSVCAGFSGRASQPSRAAVTRTSSAGQARRGVCHFRVGSECFQGDAAPFASLPAVAGAGGLVDAVVDRVADPLAPTRGSAATRAETPGAESIFFKML